MLSGMLEQEYLKKATVFTILRLALAHTHTYLLLSSLLRISY